jgi:Cu2+-exporting ATPase
MGTESLRATCAQCGLPLTSRSAAAAAEIFCCHACRLVALIVGRREQGELAWNLLRLGLGALLSMNVMMISLLLYAGSIAERSVPAFRLALLALSGLALATLLPPFIRGAVREMADKRMSLDVLIAGGSLAAFAVSAVSTLRGDGEIYFDTATMLPVLVTIGRIIESTAKTRAAELLRSLESLLPASALRVTGADTAEVPLDRLRPGDLIRVRPGERVAVDGRIVEGITTIEEAAFTGEFLPRRCGPGGRVIAGTVNGSGTLLVRAEQTGEALLLHGIIAMIGEAWRNPSRAERLAERLAARFIPLVLAVSAGSALAWAMLGDPARGWLGALSVLVVACPCTMGIATPLATSLAIARAAGAGIIVRGGAVMERIAGIELMFFDKTGTITVGRPAVQAIRCHDPQVAEEELLGRLATLESASEHILGQAVVKEASIRGIPLGSASHVQVYPGSGIGGQVTWQGRPVWMTAGTAAFVCADTGMAPLEAAGTTIEVAWDGRFRGRIVLADALRGEAAECIQALRESDISCALLSGDNRPAAAAVARQTGIERVEAPRSPAEKLAAITAAADRRVVAMVGDGINDAPALAAAQVGIALGGAPALARQSGNVVILSERLDRVVWLVRLSRRTRNIINGNFAWSFGYNAIALAAAAAGLLHPLLAAAAMVASSITVLGNSMRVLRFPDKLP